METGDDGQPILACLECGSPLENHQPDAELPELFLATCDLCKSWHLVNFEDDDAIATVIKLPSFAHLRRVLHP